MDKHGGRNKYEIVADAVETQISNGLLRANERVPSIRSMSRSFGVSVGTVIQAYLHLERRGLLQTRPRSGYFVSSSTPGGLGAPTRSGRRSTRPLSISPQVIDTVVESLRRTDLIALNSAVALSASRINGRLNSIARRAIRERPGNANELSLPPGSETLRRAVAKQMTATGLEAGADDVVVTSGTLDAIALSLGVLCKAGDTVLVESPTYFGILQVIQYLRLKTVEVPNHAIEGIDVQAVENAIGKTHISAAVLQSSFNNPTGAVTSDENKKRIVAAFARAGIPIVEDDIYGELYFRGDRPKPFSAFDDKGIVICCGSASKTVALGYRVGWAISTHCAPAIARAKYFSSVACPTLQQEVLSRYYATRVHDRHLRRVREHLAENFKRFIDTIGHAFPEGTRVSNPAGGVVLWLELPEHVDSIDLFQRALAHKIGIAPGIIFSAQADYRNFIRLSAGANWTPEVEKAIKVLGRLAR
jgi:DNA-binding transcriptional MocR family regulator